MGRGWRKTSARASAGEGGETGASSSSDLPRCVPASTSDIPDDDFLDSNCDGIDGDVFTCDLRVIKRLGHCRRNTREAGQDDSTRGRTRSSCQARRVRLHARVHRQHCRRQRRSKRIRRIPLLRLVPHQRAGEGRAAKRFCARGSWRSGGGCTRSFRASGPTRATYLHCAAKFLDAVGKPIKQVTRDDVEQFPLAQTRDGRTPRTRNIHLASIRWLLRAAGRRDGTRCCGKPESQKRSARRSVAATSTASVCRFAQCTLVPLHGQAVSGQGTSAIGCVTRLRL